MEDRKAWVWMSGERGCLTMERRTGGSFVLVGIHNSVIGWRCVPPLPLTLLDLKNSGKDRVRWGNVSAPFGREILSITASQNLKLLWYLPAHFSSLTSSLYLSPHHHTSLPKFSHSFLLLMYSFHLLLSIGPSPPFFSSHLLCLLPSNSFLPPLSHSLLVYCFPPSPEPSPSCSDSFSLSPPSVFYSSLLPLLNLTLLSPLLISLFFLFLPHLQLCGRGGILGEKREICEEEEN